MRPTKRAAGRRAAALAGARRAQRFCDFHLPLPPALRDRMELVRLLDGRPLTEWARATLAAEADRLLTRRPGLLWARPDAPIYSAASAQPGGTGVPIAQTCGGERVLVISRLEGVGPFTDTPDSSCESLSTVAYLCDLMPESPDGVGMRGVILRAGDAVPLALPAAR